ncbi:protein kinase [Streptomyces sp. NPDC052396]|uniref:serine/threonine-protein kinase n=1 Tax=Streptomyces sp. NPDC052396 TaxID=3365689 RepID=UPI0037CD26CE
MSPLRAGDPGEVAGYRLLARIGEGGMGSVFLSRTRGRQPVALKVIRREFADDEEYRLRFQQEVRAARQVRGYHVVPVVDHDTTGARPWLASTYIPGLSVASALEAYGPLPVPVVLRLAGGVAEALRAVHAAGIIHRDLKPSNILIGSEGPWVIDFGIARAADSTQLTRSGGVVGTPQYMAPEHVAGEPLTPAADLFSLGLVVAVAATGHHPFGDGQATTLAHRIGNAAASPPDLSDYPAALHPLLDRCLDADPQRRPEPGELAAICAQACGGEPLGFLGWLPAPLAAENTRREQTVAALPDTPLRTEAGPVTAGPDGLTQPPSTTGLPGPNAPGTVSGTVPGDWMRPEAGIPTPPASPVPEAVRHKPASAWRRRRTSVLAGAGLAVLGIGAALHWGTGGNGGATGTPRPPSAATARGASPSASAGTPSGSSTGATASAVPAVPVFAARPLTLRPPSGNTLFADLDVPQTTTDNSHTAGVVELYYDNIDGGPDIFHRLHFVTPTGVSSGTTYQQCLAGAQTDVLPSDIAKKDLIDGTTLHKGMVLCTITTEHNLAMIEIKDVVRRAELPEFDTQLTLWRIPN